MGSMGKKSVLCRSFRLGSSLGRACFSIVVPLASFLSLSWLLTVMRMSCISVYSLIKCQKRASVLLLDVSQSFISASNAPTTPIGSAPPIPRPLSSHTLSTPLPSLPLSPSLLDDNNDDTIRMASVMTPDSKKTLLTTLMPSQLDGWTKPSNKPTMPSSDAKT